MKNLWRFYSEIIRNYIYYMSIMAQFINAHVFFGSYKMVFSVIVPIIITCRYKILSISMREEPKLK